MFSLFSKLKRFISNHLIHYLSTPSEGYVKPLITNSELVKRTIQPGDILLVEGDLRYSKAIKYLTQSIWSHSSLYVGDYFGLKDEEGRNLDLFDADIEEGARLISIEEYEDFNIRICRPKNLTHEDRVKLFEFIRSKLGVKYDVKHIYDLLKFLIYPPLPDRLKRSFLELGSRDPSKAICSSVIAQGFQYIHYPIDPILIDGKFQKTHHSLITPSDYDRSPFFSIVKPTLDIFDYKTMRWDPKK